MRQNTHPQKPDPDFASMYLELGRKGMTLQLQWEEYIGANPNGLRYSQFCQRYRRWCGHLDISMRQQHCLGEKLFVDYAGPTIAVVDIQAGTTRQAQLFVAVLGASRYTYLEATFSQNEADWQASHMRCFEHLGGVPEVVVPDNLKSAVTTPDRYEPLIQESYAEFARHYRFAVVPARVRKPKDKAHAEAGVLLAERWVLARRRKRVFFSLDELNEALRELLDALNGRPFRRLPTSRKVLFETEERACLRPLPETRFESATWSKVTIGKDYHVELRRHYYSVPYTLVGQVAELRVTARTIEVLVRGKRVASHVLSSEPGTTTSPEHLHPRHKAYLNWTPASVRQWAATIGANCQALVEHLFTQSYHSSQALRSAAGLASLARHYPAHRLDAACAQSLALERGTYRSVKAILASGLETPEQMPPAGGQKARHHEHIRGPEYYATETGGASC